MLLNIAALLAGMALLVLAGDILVKGAVGLAENIGISPLVIGLTVVAFGTSAPELFVSLQAALGGSPGIAVGNIVGSNIANVLLIIGLPALIAPVLANQPGLRRNMTAMLISTVLFMILLANGSIGRLEGALLFAGLLAFVVWQVRTAMASGETADSDVGEAPHTRGRIAGYIVGGLIGLPIAAQLVVWGASNIAAQFGISDAVIGLTIVAVGTSLPELATTFMAALRKRGEIAIGNVVGSNIFNILGIMGLTALIIPVPVDPRMIAIDMWVMLGAAIVLATLAYARIAAGKLVGGVLLAGFVAYMASMAL
jgi:cation:H+ antiporter